MIAISMKKYPTIACCGIDCGLCPRYHTDGKSKCPGCGGNNFYEKHPSCSILNCCVKKKQIETCADCSEFPCKRMKHWDRSDSFVTHKNSLVNLNYIRETGLPIFIKQQNKRIRLLEKFLKDYDDGKSKSYFCIALTLLPIEDIEAAIKGLNSKKNEFNDKKSASKFLKDLLQKAGNRNKVNLTYRKKLG